MNESDQVAPLPFHSRHNGGIGDGRVVLDTGAVVTGKCGVYEDRPTRCRDYPQAGDVRPDTCTYSFEGNKRIGTCQPEVCSVHLCCGFLRAGGEPEAPGAPREAGGLPCKHLFWTTVMP